MLRRSFLKGLAAVIAIGNGRAQASVKRRSIVQWDANKFNIDKLNRMYAKTVADRRGNDPDYVIIDGKWIFMGSTQKFDLPKMKPHA